MRFARREFTIGRDAPGVPRGRVGALTFVPLIIRDGPVRFARLCREMPHRWWPMGRHGKLCLRCSQHVSDPR